MGAHASNLIADQMLQDVLESEEQNPTELFDEADCVTKYGGAVDYNKLARFFSKKMKRMNRERWLCLHWSI
jgi:hypothetical protein